VTEPTTVGQISKPVYVALNASNAVVLNLRGTTVGSATSTLAQDIQSGDGSTVAFTLPATPVSENNVLVFISGVWQQRDTYSVSGATLTFSTAPPSGTDNVEFVVIGSVSIGTASATDAGATLTLGTYTALSGTSVSFTGIPAGTKMIIMTGTGLSANGTGGFKIQIGDSGGLETASYQARQSQVRDSASTFLISPTDGFPIGGTGQTGAESIENIKAVLVLTDTATNRWTCTLTAFGTSAGTNYMFHSIGARGLDSELDRIALLTDGDTLDAGSINIAYK